MSGLQRPFQRGCRRFTRRHRAPNETQGSPFFALRPGFPGALSSRLVLFALGRQRSCGLGCCSLNLQDNKCNWPTSRVTLCWGIQRSSALPVCTHTLGSSLHRCRVRPEAVGSGTGQLLVLLGPFSLAVAAYSKACQWKGKPPPLRLCRGFEEQPSARRAAAQPATTTTAYYTIINIIASAAAAKCPTPDKALTRGEDSPAAPAAAEWHPLNAVALISEMHACHCYLPHCT